MASKGNRNGKLFVLTLFGCFVVVFSISLVVNRPDRPVEKIVLGSSSGPAFVVQVIRPRLGLPMAGILPPQIFGQDAYLGFDSESSGASVKGVQPNRIELAADGWELVLRFDDEGQVLPETYVEFEFLFQDRLRKVRCWPSDPAVGTFVLEKAEQLSGSFDIELPRCEDAETGVSLGWPPTPLILHGSFDKLLPLSGGDVKSTSDGSRG